MTREAHYREKLRHRARGVRELDRYVGGVFGEIDERRTQRKAFERHHHNLGPIDRVCAQVDERITQANVLRLQRR